MAQSLMVLATEPDTGKSILSLGLLDQFERHGVRAGYFKPVGVPEEGSGRCDTDAHLVHRALRLPGVAEDSVAMCSKDVSDAIQAGRYDQVLDEILEAHGRLAATRDVVICEGVDSLTAFPALDSDINIDIAKNIDASILLVVSARNRSIEEVVSNIRLSRGQLLGRGAQVLGVVVNRTDERVHGDFSDMLRHELRDEVGIYGIFPNIAELSKPRVRDVVRALNAKVLEGEEGLDHRIGPILVCAMGLEHALHYFEKDALLITPGDREEILLAAAAAFASNQVPRPAGIVLTGNFEPRRKVMQLVNGLTRRRMPILQVARPTYEAAIVVHHTEPRMHEHQQDKVLAIRAAMEEYFQIDKLLGHKYTPEIASMTPRRFLRQLREKARTDLRTIVLPEGNVDRMLQAAALIRVQKVAKIAILGTEDDVLGRARLLGVEFDDGVTVIDHLQDPEVEDYVQTIIELRKHKGLPENMARDLMRDPNYFGAMMVHKGRADGMVSGSTTTTQATLRPAFEFIRTAPGCETVSSVFFMCLPGRVLVYGDCAVIPNPTALELAEIALASAGTAAAFGIEPRVAMLSYSTGSSGKGVDVDKVVEATAIVKARNPALLIEGPIQYDAAVDSVVAQTKLPDSLVAGRATVLIFPDLNTGNNTYKAVQRSADVIAIGPILQGLRRPVNDLSRGATVIDIVNTIIVTAIQSQSMVRKR